MNSEGQDSEFSQVTTPGFTVGSGTPSADFNSENTPLLPESSPSGETGEQIKQILDQVLQFVAGLPDYFSKFFEQYRQGIIIVGLVFGSLISVKLTLALLDAVNDIPLLSPTFELIGVAYTVWFVYRYLWQASSRKELTSQVNQWKEQITGKGLPKS